jgi:hypothetical protein
LPDPIVAELDAGVESGLDVTAAAAPVELIADEDVAGSAFLKN